MSIVHYMSHTFAYGCNQLCVSARSWKASSRLATGRRRKILSRPEETRSKLLLSELPCSIPLYLAFIVYVNVMRDHSSFLPFWFLLVCLLTHAAEQAVKLK